MQANPRQTYEDAPAQARQNTALTRHWKRRRRGSWMTSLGQRSNQYGPKHLELENAARGEADQKTEETEENGG